MNHDLTGRTALITGATQNLGYSIATEFAERGATVVVHGLSQADKAAQHILQQVPDANVKSISFDLAQPEAIRAGFEQLAQQGIIIDTLVNNAAHLGLEEPDIRQHDLSFFRQVLEVNVFGTILCSTLAVEHMEQHGRGSIVNISSLAGQRAIHGRLSYNTSKAAIDGMTRSLAIDLGQKQITVNAIAPGYIWSDRWEHIDASETARRPGHIPLQRPTQQSEIAALAAFLASDNAATLTGAVVIIDGGLSAQQTPN